MEPSKQIQPYLPGMENMSESGKAPHEMSPEEFAAHPYAVFHGTTSPDSVTDRRHEKLDVNTGELRPAVMHAGTKQSAVDRIRHKYFLTSFDPETALSDRQGNPAKVYTMWAIPKKKEIGVNYADSLATNHDDPYPHDIYTGRPSIEIIGRTGDDKNKSLGYYRNEAEDKGSVSLGTRRPDVRFKLQAEYVKEAIDAGKENEVHPRTLALYKQGHLSEGEVIHGGNIMAPGGVLDGRQQLDLGLRAPAPNPMPVHEGGPELKRIRQQYKRDKGKPGQ